MFPREHLSRSLKFLITNMNSKIASSGPLHGTQPMHWAPGHVSTSAPAPAFGMVQAAPTAQGGIEGADGQGQLPMPAGFQATTFQQQQHHQHMHQRQQPQQHLHQQAWHPHAMIFAVVSVLRWRRGSIDGAVNSLQSLVQQGRHNIARCIQPPICCRLTLRYFCALVPGTCARIVARRRCDE